MSVLQYCLYANPEGQTMDYLYTAGAHKKYCCLSFLFYFVTWPGQLLLLIFSLSETLPLRSLERLAAQVEIYEPEVHMRYIYDVNIYQR